MKLIFVRHGQTDSNIQKVNKGKHAMLTKKGISQAQAVAKRLKTENISKIIVSTLIRAKDTAEPIIKNHKEAEVIYSEDIVERDFGEKAFEKEYGFWVKDAKEKGIALVDYKPEGGESIRDVIVRMTRFLNGLIHDKSNYGKTIVIVSHGAFITQVLFHLADVPGEERERRYDEFHPDNTGISIVEVKDVGKHEITLINCTKHLD